MSTACRLLIDPPAPGAWNMAVDEVLLDWSAATGGCCWRFYRWSEPTLSLGYFQEYHDRDSHPSSRRCAVVRRASGGGAILHDAELTYSVVVPLAHPLGKRREMLYHAVHATLVETLAAWNVRAVICCGVERKSPGEQPFLCFQRRANGDVLVAGTKIAGSAQRRNRGSVLQHGSVLLRSSPLAPELDSLSQFAPQGIHEGDLIRHWTEKLAERFDLVWQEGHLVLEEQSKATTLAVKYGSEEWVRYRGRNAQNLASL